MVTFVLREGIRYNICVVCGKEFRGRFEGHGNFYRQTCSPECEFKNKSNVQSTAWTDERKEYISKLFTGREVTWNVRKGKDHKNWKGGKSPKSYRRIAFEEIELDLICSICGSENNLCVHHKDHNRSNNTKENLTILCKPCHTSQHSKIGDCGWSIHNKTIIPKIGVEELKRELVLGKSIRQICREYNVCHHTLNNMMKKHNINNPRKRKT